MEEKDERKGIMSGDFREILVSLVESDKRKAYAEKRFNNFKEGKDLELPVLSKKIFNYSDGEYHINSVKIFPSRKTLYFVLFDATYHIAPDGGRILYSKLKDYLKSNKTRYKSAGKSSTFWQFSIPDIEKALNNNLLRGKGILKLAQVMKLISAEKRNTIFTKLKGEKGYYFNNSK